MNLSIDTNPTLRQAWLGIQKAKPGIRIRDAAEALGCSEAELLATTVSEYSTRLDGNWTELVKRLPDLGRVMSLTRNESCVLEHKGSFQKIDIMGDLPNAMATVIGPIETRIFFNAWKYGFAVRQQSHHGLMQSLQFFDVAGNAITKIFLQHAIGNKPGSNQEVFDQIVNDFTSKDQAREIVVTAINEAVTKSIGEVDKEALLKDWSDMKDTHEFFALLRKYQVNRVDAVELARNKFTYQIKSDSLRILLEKAAATKLPIMIFAGNRGNLQIHQGKIQTIRVMDQWLNVLDPDFNMHLREDQIHSVWVVRKPTSDGIVTGIEVFDAKKNMIVQFFGLRKPGLAELEGWRKLVDELTIA